MKYETALALSLAFGLAACGGGSTNPTPNPTPVPTPTPTPTATPTPAAIACSAPLPPPVNGWRVKVQNDGGYRKVLDSRALVGPSVAYCSALGFGGDTCVARNEEDPQAVTCQNLVVGVATDTQRYGPTWSWIPPGGFTPQPCVPAGTVGQEPGCKNHPDNQYFIFAYGPGTFSPCAANGVCGGFVVQ